MKTIKIDFVDFWPGFNKEDNFFSNLLKEKFNVLIDEKEPDTIFYSVFGNKHVEYSCKKIFYTGENRRPNFFECDLAFSFDFTKNKKHFRLPLYYLYIDGFGLKDSIEHLNTKEAFREIWKQKKKFCAMVVSNPNAKERIQFFKKLSKIKHVDSGGGVLNNIGGRVKDKLEFINQYKFVIAFENEICDGYTTEKILEPILKHCIPIYWGNKLIHKDFNSKRFINYHDFENEDQLIDKILEIDKDPQKALEIISQPIFSEEKGGYLKSRNIILEKIDSLYKSKSIPVSKTLKGKTYRFFKRIFKIINKLLFKIKILFFSEKST